MQHAHALQEAASCWYYLIGAAQATFLLYLCVQVGLTNMDVDAVSSIVDAGVPVANNQVNRGKCGGGGDGAEIIIGQGF